MVVSFIFFLPFPLSPQSGPHYPSTPKTVVGRGVGVGVFSQHVFFFQLFTHSHYNCLNSVASGYFTEILKIYEPTHQLHSFEIFLYSPLYSHSVQFRGHPNPRTTVPLYTCALATSLKYLKFTNQPTSYALFCLFLYSVQSSCAAGGTSKSKNQLSLCTHALAWSDIFFLCSTICLKHYFAKSRQRYPNTLSSSRSSLKTSLF